MRILVSEGIYGEHGATIRAVVPDTGFVLFGADGRLRTEDGMEAGPGDEDGFEVAWATHDLFLGHTYPEFFAWLASATGLRWVQSPGAGVDGPMFGALLDRGVRLTTSHVTSIPIAEFVMRSVLDVFQRPAQWAAGRAARRWDQVTFREVFGTTWLIVGVGAIGTDVALRARAFGARVIGCRRHPDGTEPVDAMIRPHQLVATIGGADVVVLAAPANADTHHVVDGTALGAMKAGSVLVNVARGSLVDEAALLRALDVGRPAVAVLDAVATEPPVADSPLWDHPRVVLTPHTAYAGEGSPQRNVELFAANLGRYVEGRELINEQHPQDADAGGGRRG